MTTYGPCKRFTIRTLDSVITITGSNMVATVTGCDGGSAPFQGDVSSSVQNEASNTARQDDCLELGSSHVGESASSVDNQPLAFSDMESLSHNTPVRRGLPRWRCPLDVPNSTVTHESAVDSSRPSDIGPTAGECGNPNHSTSESEQGYASPITTDSDYIPDSNSESQLTAELQSIGNKRKYSNVENGNSEDSLKIRRRTYNSVSQTGGDSNSDPNCNPALQLESAGRKSKGPSSGGSLALPPGHTPPRSHRKKPYSCDTCGKTFTQPWSLATHARIHTGERPYSCDVCGKTFTQAGNLSQHVRIHTGEKPYSCSTCGKTFTTSTCLTQHIRIHTGERPYICDVCGKAFSQVGNLSQHARIHTGERPYSCDTCGKTFTASSHLIEHIRIHTGERPFSCDTCGKAFTSSSNFSKHLRIHTGERPYSCDTCGKTFSRAGNLAKHICVHSGAREKPFSCNTCGKTFITSAYLSQHVLTHTGEKLYPCGTCGKTFTLAGSLSKHVHTHTRK